MSFTFTRDATHGSGNISNNTAWSISILIVLFNVGLILLEQFCFLTSVNSFGLFYIIGRW